MRSLLTVLSILIGIMAIFALVSFGQGIGKYMDDIFEEMGTDKIMVQPKGFSLPGSSSVNFNDEDISFMKEIRGVEEITGLMMVNGEVKT